MSLTSQRRRLRQAGLSLVELMVGITIGLIVVAAASLMMTNQVKENSQLLLEVQLQQDLRAVAELMLRDIRRAGYNSGAATGVWTASTDPGAWTNIYAPTSSPDKRDTFYYSYGLAAIAGAVPAGNQSFGFELVKDDDTGHGVVYALLGSSFEPTAVPNAFQYPSGTSPAKQPLTDPGTIDVTDLIITLINQPTAVGKLANPYRDCAVGDTDCPCLVVRRVNIQITGRSVRHQEVRQTLTLNSRIRNDQILPSCNVPPP